MSEFRLTQISDTHLARRLQKLTDNFHRVSEHIDATRPDLVINSGDISFDGPTSRSDLEFAKELHDALPVPCRHLPGNWRHGTGSASCSSLANSRSLRLVGPSKEISPLLITRSGRVASICSLTR